ncbi:MAG: hypothetical protein ACXWVT_06200, partial [Burkholderiaceae bacterium]
NAHRTAWSYKPECHPADFSGTLGRLGIITDADLLGIGGRLQRNTHSGQKEPHAHDETHHENRSVNVNTAPGRRAGESAYGRAATIAIAGLVACQTFHTEGTLNMTSESALLTARL